MASTSRDRQAEYTYRRNVGRSKACSRCRTRKLKCDGARPHCTPCEVAWQRLSARKAKAGTPLLGSISCEYLLTGKTDVRSGSIDPQETPSINSETALLSPSVFTSYHEEAARFDKSLQIGDTISGNTEFLEEQIHIFIQLYPSLALFHPESLLMRMRLPREDPDRVHDAGK